MSQWVEVALKLLSDRYCHMHKMWIWYELLCLQTKAQINPPLHCRTALSVRERTV